MIKLIENLNGRTAERLTEFFGSSLEGMYVLISVLDYTNVDGAWVQTQDDEVTALVVQKEKSKVFVTATGNADYYELGDFISRLGGMVIHCGSKVTEKIGMTSFSKISLMALNNDIDTGRNSVELNDDLRPVFDLLTKSRQKIIKGSNAVSKKELKNISDRAYKEWLSRTSRGIFNGFTTVRAVKSGENSILSVAVAERLGNIMYIRDVATDSDFRKMGYASDCISGICRDFKREGDTVFLACNDLAAENFYKKIGFERKAYLDLGIIEL